MTAFLLLFAAGLFGVAAWQARRSPLMWIALGLMVVDAVLLFTFAVPSS